MSVRLPMLFALLLAPTVLTPETATVQRPRSALPAAPDATPRASRPHRRRHQPQRVLLVTSRMGEILVELDAAAAPAIGRKLPGLRPRRPLQRHHLPPRDPGAAAAGAAPSPPTCSPSPAAHRWPAKPANGLSNRRGTLAAARDRGVVDSATAQFFFNLADNPASSTSNRRRQRLHRRLHGVRPRRCRGMDVVDRIAAVPTGAQGAVPGLGAAGAGGDRTRGAARRPVPASPAARAGDAHRRRSRRTP